MNFLPLKSFLTSALSPNEIKKLEQLSHVSSSFSSLKFGRGKQRMKRIGIFFLGLLLHCLNHCSKNLTTRPLVTNQRFARLKIIMAWCVCVFGFYDVIFITKSLFQKQINHFVSFFFHITHRMSHPMQKLQPPPGPAVQKRPLAAIDVFLRK